MRDRLIELIREAKKHTKNANSDLERNMIFANHLLANGVIVPPCKVGAEIFGLFDNDDEQRKKSMREKFSVIHLMKIIYCGRE